MNQKTQIYFESNNKKFSSLQRPMEIKGTWEETKDCVTSAFQSLPSKFPLTRKSTCSSEKSRTSQNSEKSFSGSCSFKNYFGLDSRQKNNNMDSISFKINRNTKVSGKIEGAGDECIGTPKSRRTGDYFPSLTFGSKGGQFIDERTVSQKNSSHEGSELRDFDSLANVFYENSVSSHSGKWVPGKRKKKLSFRKRLEKKILKVKAKSIFKNKFLKKFSISGQSSFNDPVNTNTLALDFAVPKKPKKNISQKKMKNINFGVCFDLNQKGHRNRQNQLNISLPNKKEIKKMKMTKKSPKSFNFNKGFTPNKISYEQKKINNMIHGLNTSKIPTDFIDYSKLNSKLNLPSFEPISPQVYSFENPLEQHQKVKDSESELNNLRMNKLNFSFRPKLYSNIKTQDSISALNELKTSFEKDEGIKLKEQTSILNNKIFSTDTVETKSDSKILKSKEKSGESPNFFSGSLAINFNVLN